MQQNTPETPVWRRGVDVAVAFDAATPDRSLIPTGRGWVTHIEEDLAHEPERALIQPYVMAATISRYEPTQQRLFDGTQKVAVEFTGVTP